MIIERVEVIDQLLIVFHRDVRLCLLDVSDFGLIARQLLLDFLDNSLIVLYLQLDVLIGDSFSGISLRLWLLSCTS